MSEPESHTLVLLREMREEMRAQIRAVREDIRKLDRKFDANLADIRERTNSLTLSLAGELASRAYTHGGVERRFEEIENRLAAPELDN
jgi:phage shock protein A